MTTDKDDDPGWTDEVVDWYAANFGDYPTNRLTVEYLVNAQIVTPQSIVLDVGCGTASALRSIADRFAGVDENIRSGGCTTSTKRLFGVDPIPRMVEIARTRSEHYPQLDLRISSVEDLPFEDGFADVVLLLDVMDHFQDSQKALVGVGRVLKSSSGRLVMVKDGGLPDADNSRALHFAVLDAAGFQVMKEDDIEEDDVSFTLLVCKKKE